MHLIIFHFMWCMYRGETVLIVSIADNEQDDDMQSHAALSESELALMVSRTAQKYSFVTREDSEFIPLYMP